MKVEGEFVCDKRYYQTFYGDWRKHCSRWKYMDLVLGFVCLAAGIYVTIDVERRGITGFVLLAIGAWEFPRALTHQSRWVSKQLSSPRAGKTIEFRIDDNEIAINHKGDVTTADRSKVKKLTVADEGILLNIEAGKTVYIPKYAFSSTNEFESCATFLSSQTEEDEA